MENYENQIYHICLISNRDVVFFSKSSFKDQLSYMERFYRDEIIKTKNEISFDIFSVFRKRELFYGQYFQNIDISKIGIPLFISNSMKNRYRDMDVTVFDQESFKQLFFITKTKVLPQIFNNIDWDKDKIIIFRNTY